MADAHEPVSKPEAKPAVDAKQHDDVYEAVFALVGGKQKTETYEDLAKVLPAIKDADPAELKELAARKALQEMFKPKADPLRLEYERAAAEDDDDDLSTEDGTEWLQSKGLAGGDDEELDENGIPVVKLTRASSSFILDGPGDVKVDNFTPEGEDVEPGVAQAPPAASAPVALPPAPAAATPASSSSGAGAAGSSYVPSIIARAAATATSATTNTSSSNSNVAGAKAAAAPAAMGPVVTLEDELKALRAARSAAPQQSGAGAGGGSSSSGAAPADWRVSDVAVDDEDAPEIIIEPAGAPGGSRRSIQLYSASNAAIGDAAVAPGAGTAGPPGGAAAGSGSAAAASAPGAAEAEEPSCLPGECQDTTREDAVWQAMHGGVEGRALLEHMGLGGGEDGAGGEAGSGDESAGEGEAAAGARPHANGNGGLANGHAQADGGDGAASSSSSGDEAQAASGSGAPGTAAVANAPAPAAAAGATSQPAAAPGGESAPAGGAGGTTAAAAAAVGAGAASAAPAQQQEQEQQLVLCAPAPRAGAGSAGASDSGPVFEEVEKFSLDPDFDYDNVVLTRREFPYTMLGAFGRAGAGAAGMPAPR
ncbi:hypothetical protein HXX76_009247 [Chlamydomonas incerta]|uniref:Uncharacterized protein n=1 Tax=Chlamydomonas incerta TaxID=51695 RepID=A0A835T538_CHLIN|nr:hypothetical protein HXX76_009247 [Chlamydomonas incerta]|eukprot:KAG2431751.1 hypothetical protein HXX76_009247 [Chlamydomonas incerta]